jgi:hypothetical protein
MYILIPMKAKLGWDFLGVFFSALCVVHCLAVPLVILLFPAIGLDIFPQEDLTHAILFGFILGIAGLAFWRGYRVHGQWRPVIWMAIGLLIILYATFHVHHQLGHMWEPVFAILGSLALIRAHFLNHHCKKCAYDHVSHHHDTAKNHPELDSSGHVIEKNGNSHGHVHGHSHSHGHVHGPNCNHGDGHNH